MLKSESATLYPPEASTQAEFFSSNILPVRNILPPTLTQPKLAGAVPERGFFFQAYKNEMHQNTPNILSTPTPHIAQQLSYYACAIPVCVSQRQGRITEYVISLPLKRFIETHI